MWARIFSTAAFAAQVSGREGSGGGEARREAQKESEADQAVLPTAKVKSYMRQAKHRKQRAGTRQAQVRNQHETINKNCGSLKKWKTRSTFKQIRHQRKKPHTKSRKTARIERANHQKAILYAQTDPHAGENAKKPVLPSRKADSFQAFQGFALGMSIGLTLFKRP